MLFILMFLLQICRVTKRSVEEDIGLKVTCGLKHRLQVANTAEQRHRWASYRGQQKKKKVKWNEDIYEDGRVGTRQPHTSRNCLPSPLMVHSLTTAFISLEGESLHSSLTGETYWWDTVCSGLCIWNPVPDKMTKHLHTLLWFQCSSLRLRSKPQTCHRGIQCTVGKTWHSRFSPGHAGSILQRKENSKLLMSMNTYRMHTNLNS